MRQIHPPAAPEAVDQVEEHRAQRYPVGSRRGAGRLRHRRLRRAVLFFGGCDGWFLLSFQYSGYVMGYSVLDAGARTLTTT
jgi:hypothetical protein